MKKICGKLLYLILCFFSSLYTLETGFMMTGNELLNTGFDEQTIIPSTGEVITQPLFLSGVLFSGTNISSGINIDEISQIQFIEIFPRDTLFYGEYIGIKFSKSFTGMIRLVGLGNGSSEKNVSIQAYTGEIIYLTDSPQKFLSSTGQQVINVPSITLTDTGEPLEIWLGIELQDKVIYTQSSLIDSLFCGNEKNSSGYRLCAQFNKPTLISILDSPLSTTTGLNLGTGGIDLLTGIYNGTGILTSTGTIYGTGINSDEGTTLSGSGGGPIIPFRIEEIYPYDLLFPEYIELLSLEKYSGTIIIGGLGQGTASKTITIDTLPGIRRIITEDSTKFPYYPFVLGVSSISLTNEGEELSLLLPNLQQIDRVVYSGQQEMKSLVFGDLLTSGSGEARGFYQGDSPTPGYVWGMITHHLPKPTLLPHCGIHRQHTTPLFSDKKLNVQAVVDDVFIQNSQLTYTCERILSGSRFEYITGCNPSYLEFQSGLWPITLRISKNNTPLCELSQQLNLPSLTITKSEKEEKPQERYYEGLYRKRKEKYDALVKQVRSFGYAISLSGELKMKGSPNKDLPPTLPEGLLVSGGGPPSFVIHSVVPNPKGKDSEGERLVLENLTDDLIISDNLMLSKGKSSSGLPKGIDFPPGIPVEIVGNIGLPNSPTCISLRFRKEKKSLALFCYPQVEEDEVYTGGMIGFETIEEQQRLQDLSLDITDTQACVYIGIEEIVCKTLPYMISEAKQRKKDARSLIFTKKKVLSLQEKYDLRREKYATLSKNNKKREVALNLRNRQLRGDVILQKTQKSIFRSMYWLLKKKLGAERTPLYKSQTVQDLNFLYDELVFFQNTTSMQLGPIHMSPDEVDARYDLYFEGKMPNSKVDLPKVIDYLTQGFEDSKTVLGSLFIDD